jgi:hypothetical protein
MADGSAPKPYQDVRTAFRDKLTETLTGHVGSVEEAVEAVRRLFSWIRFETEENEVTALGDTRERFVWSKVLVASFVVETGSYEGKPRG